MILLRSFSIWKRLLVGGFERVFELGKNFRNEGISTKHNPEYTSGELYAAYADADFMMQLTEEIFGRHRPGSSWFHENRVPGTGDRPDSALAQVPMLEAIKQYSGVDLTGMTAEQARQAAKEKGLEVEPNASYGSVVDEFFGHLVEPKPIQPTFITEHPVDVSPLG